jgi:hypothetical protein
MEISQENSLCSHLYYKQAKMSFFSFFFYKIREEALVLPMGGGGVWYQWEGELMGKGHGRVNTVQVLCTHVCKWKNDSC